MYNSFGVQIVQAPNHLSNNDSGVELRDLVVAVQERHQITTRSKLSERVPMECKCGSSPRQKFTYKECGEHIASMYVRIFGCYLLVGPPFD